MTITAFAADLHLKPGAQPEQNSTLRNFLRELIDRRVERLILLGDVFNFWFERGGKMVGDYAETLAVFAEFVARGLKIEHLSGNRDFMLGMGDTANDAAAYRGFFRGCRNANQPSKIFTDGKVSPRGFIYQFTQDGEQIFCLHGDMYAIAQPQHGMMRWWTMSLPLRYFFAWLPFFILRIIFAALQNRGTLPYRELLPKTELIEPAVLSDFADAGVDHFFCGHFHTDYRALPVHGKKRDATLHILPCWLNHGAFALLDNRRVEIF